MQPSDCTSLVPCRGSEGYRRLRADTQKCSMLVEGLGLWFMLAQDSVGLSVRGGKPLIEKLQFFTHLLNLGWLPAQWH